MNSFNFKFPHQVRIFGGGFDASARASHRKAALENVSGATIERKTMSTKTTLKRIALVAVAATGFGLMSAVPSNAASQSDTLTASVITSSTTIGSTVTTVLTNSYIATASVDTVTITASLQSGPADNVALPILSNAGGTNVNAVAVTGAQKATIGPMATAPTRTTAYVTASLTVTHAGTYVVKFTPALDTGNAGPLNSVPITWTVTVSAAGTVTAANSTSFIAAGTTIGTVDVTVAAPMAAATTAGSQRATIKVTSNNSVPTDLSQTTTLSASISGPGSLGFGGNTGTNNVAVGSIPSSGRAITGLAGQNLIAVFSDGVAGTSIITISAGTLVLATETVVFYGAIGAIAATVVNGVIATTNAGGSATGAITAIAKDSGGSAVAGSLLYITSSDLTVLNASYLASTGVTDSAGKATFDLPVGLKAGTVTLTVGNGSTLALTTVSAPAVSVRVGSETAASVTVLFDKNAYTLGEAAVVTVALLDAAGLPVANGVYANIFTSTGLVSNFALTGTSLVVTGITTTKNTGTQTFAVSMPAFAADVVLSGTGGTGLPAAAQVAITSSMASVSNPSSDAATDAANAATDAANYAADAADAATTAAEEATAAAQAAQESADAATAAVVELSTKVSALVDALRAQITSLGNYVAKVAAALGRVGTRLNKVLARKK